MPYIEQEIRKILQPTITNVINALRKLGVDNRAGNLNYTICTILNALYPNDRYREFNDMMGLLDCIAKEMYRRRVAPYEDKAITKNGDIFNEST